MDNQASSGIVNQDSNIEAPKVEILPPLLTTQASTPPTESDVGSHLKEMSWRNGAEVLTEIA